MYPHCWLQDQTYVALTPCGHHLVRDKDVGHVTRQASDVYVATQLS